VIDPLDTPLTVIPQEAYVTVYAPGVIVDGCSRRKCSAHTSDWREQRFSPANDHGATAEPVATLREVMTHRYNTPALCTGYVVMRDGVPLPRCPRVAKSSIAWLRTQGLEVMTTCFIADIDTPGHLPWTAETRAEFERLWASAPPSLRTVAMYTTGKGLRMFQPLREAIPAETAEPRLHAWYAQLVADGVWATILECKDWSHIMRVANHVKAGGKRFDSDWVSFERCVAIDAPAPLAGSLPRLAKKRRTAQPVEGAVVSVPVFAEECPAGWTIVADMVGAAIRDTVASDWRQCYLALSGALLDLGCEAAALPAVIARAHMVDPQWAQYLHNRTAIARTTAVRWLSGLECTGWHMLTERFPGVAEALDRALGENARIVARVRRRLVAPAPKHVPSAEAFETLGREIRDAYGVTLIAGPPGLGKTQGIIEHARRLPVIGNRARPGERVGLGTPHHDLAMQIRRDLPERSVRLYGPLAHRQADGSYTCIHRDAAAPMAEGGQSVEWEFCKGRGKSPCERFQACEARLGAEGPANANLYVGPHEKLGELDAAAGPAGVLVIDEPEGVVTTESLTLDQFDTARRFLDAFVPRYTHAIAPALAALTAWARTAQADAAALRPLPEAIAAGAAAVSAEMLGNAGIDPEMPADMVAEAILETARGAILADAKSKAPPIQWVQMQIARKSPGRAAELGAASRVLDLLWRGLVARPVHAARIDARGDSRTVTLTGLDEMLARAVRRNGPVVMLGADVALHLAAVEKLMGCAPRFVDLRVADGVPVARTIYATSGATRKRWCPRAGAPDWSGGFLQALRAALAWAAEDPSTKVLAVMTWAVFAAAIGHTLDPDARGPRELWKACGQAASDLDEARARLAPILATWSGTILVGHYHHLRGLNYMRDADAGVTLGDPRPNVGQVEDQALYLDLEAFGRADAIAGAELEQAHGRLRTIHRTKPARLCHVGEIINPAWRGLTVDVREMPGGRPKNTAAMTASELSAIRAGLRLSLRAFADRLEVTKSTVERWEKGEGRGTAIPMEVALRARSLVSSVPQTPALNITLRGGFAGQSPPTGGLWDKPIIGGLWDSTPEERT
jgi:DNA-binding transcriptional regulator YiaG